MKVLEDFSTFVSTPEKSQDGDSSFPGTLEHVYQIKWPYIPGIII
jgi:hypothetical protein